MTDPTVRPAAASTPLQKKPAPAARASLAVLAGLVLLSGFYFAQKSGSDPAAYGNDFNVYYNAARQIIAGQTPYEHSLGEWTPYIYPPLLADLIVALAWLPLPVAAYVWFLLNVLGVGSAAWMSARIAIRKNAEDSSQPSQAIASSSTWIAAVAVCALLMAARFVLDSFSLGQVNPLVAGLVVAHVYLYGRDRKALSALALVFAISFKLTPALLILYHIGKLRLKFASGCCALLALVTVLSFLPFGPRSTDVFRVFVNRTIKNEQGYDLRYSGNQSLRGTIARLIVSHDDDLPKNPSDSRDLSDPTTLLISMLILGVALFAATRSKNELSAAAPFVCCTVLLSPLSWKAHYVILILPLAGLIAQSMYYGRTRRWTLVALAVVFALFNLTSPRLVGRTVAEWADYHSLIFAGGLIVFLASAFVALSDRLLRKSRKFGKLPDLC